AGPINSVDQVVADAGFQERSLIATLDDGGRLTPHIGLGIHIDGQTARPRAAAPRLGADTDAVLGRQSSRKHGDIT
ncbi:MAG: CoA transferase, partial [Pseudomonadota bacterium]